MILLSLCCNKNMPWIDTTVAGFNSNNKQDKNPTEQLVKKGKSQAEDKVKKF